MDILNVCRVLFTGLGTTLTIFFFTILFSVPIACIIAILNNKKRRIISKIISGYILIIRGTPMILQIIVVYFAPYYIFKVSIDRFIAVIIAFVLNFSAYFSEIFRSGIESIEKGQIEAGITLGLSRPQIYLYIVLPQVIKKIIPSFSNEVVSLIKSTSLAQIIGVSEMFSIAQKQSNFLFSTMPLVVAGMYYLVLVGIITLVFNMLEKRFSYYS